jgi:hypothetical protein
MGVVGLGLVGGMLFGKDAVSYVRSSARGVRTAVKDSVPIEFELRRARDMLEEIIPEMHANIRLIAQEEVEVAALKGEIAKGQEALKDEENKIKTLRVALEQPRVEYSFAGRNYGRSEVKADLAARFERYKESELVLASRVKLLDSREKSLAAAMQMLEKTRSQKRILEDRTEALASQYRTLQAAATGTKFQVDSSKLAQTQKLITDIQKRLDVAERVLAHESKFVQSIPVNEVDTVAETDLVAQVDDYFKTRDEGTAGRSTAAATTVEREESAL